MPSTQNAVLIFVQTGVRTYLKIVGSVWNRYMTLLGTSRDGFHAIHAVPTINPHSERPWAAGIQSFLV